MSYDIQTEEGGIKALVISGWEKGIADSPYNGITSLKNLNISYLSGSTYVNYKRQAITLTGTMGRPKFYTQSSSSSPTYYILDDKGQVWQSSSPSTSWTLLTGNHTSSGSLGYGIAYYKDYLFVFGNNYIDVCGDGTGPGAITSANWADINSSGYFSKNLTGVALDVAPIAPTTATFTAALPAGSVTGTLSSVWSGATGQYLVTFSNAESRPVTLTNGSATVTWTTGLESAVTTAITIGSTTLTLDASWPYVSGVYQVQIGGSSGQYLRGTFTNGSTNVPVVPAISISTATTTVSINSITLPATTNTTHMAIVGINDVLYFCNGSTVGSISVPPYNPAAVFKVNDFNTMYINYVELQLRQTDTATWLTEITSGGSVNLLIAVQNYIYSWDRTTTLVDNFPTQVYSATPISENPSRMINILNNIYIFAGQKGNIYISNGYSVSLFKKLPDSFLGIIDPSWVIGGMMFHRGKLWFGAVGSKSTSNAVQGIFSLTLSTGIGYGSSETPGVLNFESQNSYGIGPTSSADATGILIDGNYFYGNGYANGVTIDVYYSAYYNNNAGGIDFNDSTLWANYEPAIETDLIPIGTFFQKRTFEMVEFKLDRPLASGDSIKLSYRTTSTGSYTLVGNSQITGTAGTTTATSDTATQVVSDAFNSNIQDAQWVQFLVEFKCAASNSSFIRLREIRLH